MRRCDNWALRADQIGQPRPAVLLTESFLDLIGDAIDKMNARGGLWDALKAKYGMVIYNNDLRGVNSYENYFVGPEGIWPGISYTEALRRLLHHFHNDLLWPDFIKGAMLFGWNQRWHLPEGHDWSLPEYEEILIGLNQLFISSTPTELPVENGEQMEFPPINDPQWVKTLISVKSGSHWNIRSEPNTLPGTDIGDITVDTSALVLESDLGVTDALWIRIRHGDGYVLTGWIRADGVNIVRLNVVPVPVPEPEPPEPEPEPEPPTPEPEPEPEPPEPEPSADPRFNNLLRGILALLLSITALIAGFLASEGDTNIDPTPIVDATPTQEIWTPAP
jgi:hypothetical protein